MAREKRPLTARERKVKNQAMKNYRNRLQRLGKCLTCREPVSSLCQKCLGHKRDKQRTLYRHTAIQTDPEIQRLKRIVELQHQVIAQLKEQRSRCRCGGIQNAA